MLTQTHTNWGVEPFTSWASVWGLNVNSRMYIKAPILFKNPPLNVLWQSHVNMGGASAIASSFPLIWKLPAHQEYYKGPGTERCKIHLL